ncbi:degt/dnrj/eryc1/strs aminotransferase [Lucifera butyrica]|uniref:Degt/dnrj/eryc1/strs aminotransferase n=1 Tax=Lucifera butyrica TaxID=1351585 RepID=A0A498RAS3_9FIRM|nr:DegT/DnrJ/EryC1/StrS family aminotransferase [Lucifera butyrica]VBB08531.1 degt/dnrj/eryc1/strs aminotransferase [Lucifera butyrica]
MRLPIAQPKLNGNEMMYVMDCLETNWISSKGKYIELFEKQFAQYMNVAHAVTTSNGTTALHLSLLAFGVAPGDEVIVPTLTFVATANAVRYCGATPVFADAEGETWNIDPQAIEAKITPRTKGIIAVHLYGHPADMDPIMDIARRYGLFVVEDTAEAHGAEYKGRKVGTIGDVGAFSLYGNKIITTGEGGMITTNNAALAAKIMLLKGQGMDPERRYWHPVIGYNYRMTNIQAAIGLGQLEKIDWHIENRLRVARLYRERLSSFRELTLPAKKPWAKNVYWLFTVLLNTDKISRDCVTARLATAGIETRPVFYPVHMLPPYVRSERSAGFPVAERISRSGFNLPTYADLTEAEVAYICEQLIKSVK